MAGRFPRGLYLISPESLLLSGRFPDFLERALPMGLGWVQLRGKNVAADRLLELGREALPLCRKNGAALIVNDHVDLARELDADGVHLGQEDESPREARRKLGPDKIIGWSTHNHDQWLQARERAVDYIGFGPVFPTSTKENPDPVTGLEELGRAALESDLPVTAIGGIGPEKVAEVMKAGATAWAVVSAVGRAQDPVAATKNLLALEKAVTQAISAAGCREAPKEKELS